MTTKTTNGQSGWYIEPEQWASILRQRDEHIERVAELTCERDELRRQLDEAAADIAACLFVIRECHKVAGTESASAEKDGRYEDVTYWDEHADRIAVFLDQLHHGSELLARLAKLEAVAEAAREYANDDTTMNLERLRESLARLDDSGS